MNKNAVALGRLGGLKGGPARASALTKSRRVAIARSGGIARWRNLDLRIRSNRWIRARQIARQTGADVEVVEQVLFLQTIPPWERLARGLMRSRLGRNRRV